MRLCEIVIAISLTACAARPGAAGIAAGGAESAKSDEAARVTALRADVEKVIETIAASDPRFALRAGGAKEARLHAASVKALAEGDADAAIEDGALDFFSFTARARALDEAAAIVAATPKPEGDVEAEGEREELSRLVADERARLDEERAMPRGASALVRGIVETWGAPSTKSAVEARDARIARRLDEVAASVTREGGDVSRLALAELDDALDPLERVATPADYPKTAGTIAKLRVALGDRATRPAEDDASWSRVRASLAAHLGVSRSAEDVRALLAGAERSLRAEAKTRLASTHANERDLARRAEALTLVSGACTPAHVDSRLRALAPAAERAPICGALHALHDAADDSARLAAIVALHDDTVVALWALALHEGRATASHAAESSHPFFGAQPDREARLLRYAAARPVAAIAAGLTASLLAASLDSDLAARWIALGDAPLDLALAALGVTSSSAAPASLRP